MRVLLLGAGGMLGTDLARQAPSSVRLRGVGRAECDVTDRAAVELLLDEVAPSLLINATAYTAVDRAESERDLATRVNGHAVGALGDLCAARGVHVLHYSTDYVFPGNGSRPYRETDEVEPVNAYGASKLLGEQLLARSGAEWLVIRTQWLFGTSGRSFPRTMAERARARLATRVVDDQTGRPTSTVDLARVSWELVAAGALGLFHASNSGSTTWYELARHVFRREGDAGLLEPCRTRDFPTAARRPAFSVLDTSRLEGVLGHRMPPWEDAVDQFLGDLGDVARSRPAAR